MDGNKTDRGGLKMGERPLIAQPDVIGQRPLVGI